MANSVFTRQRWQHNEHITSLISATFFVPTYILSNTYLHHFGLTSGQDHTFGDTPVCKTSEEDRALYVKWRNISAELSEKCLLKVTVLHELAPIKFIDVVTVL